MKKILSILLFLIFFLCVSDRQAQTVKGILETKTLRKGRVGKAKIILEIPEKVHVNSAIPKTEFAIPTNLTVRGNGIKITKLTYPKGKDRKFEFTEEPINVYENRVEFKFSFFVPKNFRGQQAKLTAKLLYQACTEQVCYPPKSEAINFIVKLK